MSDKKEEVGFSLSKLLEGVVSCLNQFKEPLFSQKELEKKGITSSFQNLPCMLNIRLETNNASGTTVTSMRSELKRTRVEMPTSESGAVSSAEPKYLTYIEVGIEHSKTSWEKAFWDSRWVRGLSIVAMALLFVFLVFVGVKLADKILESTGVPQLEGKVRG